LNTKNSNPVNEQLEQVERGERALTQPAQDKKTFVEPVVSVPVDVLEATAFFQGPTVDTIQTLTT
jgi:hypothetical protein